MFKWLKKHWDDEQSMSVSWTLAILFGSMFVGVCIGVVIFR